MPVTVERATVIDPVHYNGDPFWDGDQTLYELTVRDATERADLRFVVARGDAFITAEQVARHVERLEESWTRCGSAGSGPNRIGTLRFVSRSSPATSSRTARPPLLAA